MHPQQKVIIDTGFIVAIFNENDSHHERAMHVADMLEDSDWHTTVFVLQEIFQLLVKRTNISKAINCFEELQDSLVIAELPTGWPLEISKILKKYSNLKLDLADASLVVLADQLKIPHIVSVDKKDFSILKWNSGKKHFENLFFP